MYLFKHQHAQMHSMSEIFLGKAEAQSGGGRGMIFYFDSEPPSSLAQAPFDTKNIFDIVRNSCAHTHSNITYHSDSGAFELDPYLVRGDGSVDQASLINIPYLDEANSVWRIFPRLVVNEENWQKERAGTLTTEDQFSGFRTIVPTFLAMSLDPDDFAEGNSASQFYVSPNRYAYNDPFVVEFETEQTISHVGIHQTHSGSRYDNSYFDLDVFNEDTQEWDRAERVSYPGGNDKSFVALANPVVAKTIRLVPGDTGYYGWILKYLTFYTNAEPVNIDTTKTVRWCIMLPYWNGIYNRYSGTDFDMYNIHADYSTQSNCPLLAMTVGDNDSFGTLFVEKATDIGAKQKIEPTSLKLFLE